MHLNRVSSLRSRAMTLLVLVALVLAACGSDTASVAEGTEPAVVIRDLFDPTETDAERPEGYRESVPRDAIQPIYAPTFVAPSEVDWPGDELVIGVDIDGEARAYPVGFLTFREMVIDNHRGIPTLVTW